MAAAFEQTLVTEKEKAEAAMRGSAKAKAEKLKNIEELQRRAETEQARAELRQLAAEAAAADVRTASTWIRAILVDRAIVRSNDAAEKERRPSSSEMTMRSFGLFTKS